MSFTKITNTQLNSRGATTLPNQPTISATALKEEFDAPAKNIVAPAVNNLIDELQAVTSAASLGAVAPMGRTGATVQALLTDISDDLATVETNSHTHTNKAQLDKISEDGSGNPLYDGNPIGAGAAWGDITGTLSNQTDLQTALNGKANSSHTHTKSQITDFPSLATVATSGSYNDLSNKPTIPDELDDLNDVAIASTPNNGDVLTYDSVAAKFKPQAPASGTVNNAYKNIVSAGQTFTASGEDTFKINAGSNVTITALSGDKGIQISATGGGSSTGDMLMSDYDSTGDVKTAGGIKSFVGGEIAKLDGTVSGTPGAGATLTAFSETDGKVSATFGAISITKSQVSDFPSLATVATSGSYNDLSNKPTIPSAANNGQLTIKQNGTTKGTFTADASSNTSVDIVTGDWVAESYADNGSITFTFDDTTYTSRHGFEVYIDVNSGSTNLSPYAKLTSISGEGTASCTLVYDTDADNGSSANKNAFLYRVK